MSAGVAIVRSWLRYQDKEGTGSLKCVPFQPGPSKFIRDLFVSGIILCFSYLDTEESGFGSSSLSGACYIGF